MTTPTVELDLIALDEPLIERLIADPASLAEQGLDVSAVVEVLQQTGVTTLDFYRRSGARPPWGSYLAVDAATHTVVGTCSFVGAPDAEGAVEIAYFTFPPFEGSGYANAMAGALIARAVASGQVTTITAKTLAEENASVRVLRRQGFDLVGEVVDDDAGIVWGWMRSLDTTRTSHLPDQGTWRSGA